MESGEVLISVEGAGANADAVGALDAWLAGEREQGLGDRPRRTVPRDDGEPVQGLLADIAVNLGTGAATGLVGVLLRSLHSHLRNQPDPDRTLTVRLRDGGAVTLTGRDMDQGQFEAMALRILQGLDADGRPG
ncbi:hypothetical protein LO771_27445 [Streptacidiphilus sp. ASG 303]|uniref:effector-associated constant component EACC1 n=1 Tax=Streptacidiphilus sp. ASG 303 TaxID=2896847 RepID=UPI001E3BD676|nr:hypothetical protein [Streptacidiphilus sp. ASG 303]MCD0486019.1 hypothetical protein [Streptacidiphilus sp. ASG 303]